MRAFKEAVDDRDDLDRGAHARTQAAMKQIRRTLSRICHAALRGGVERLDDSSSMSEFIFATISRAGRPLRVAFALDESQESAPEAGWRHYQLFMRGGVGLIR